MSLPKIEVQVPYEIPTDLHAVFFEHFQAIPEVTRAEELRGPDLPVYVVMATVLAPFFNGLFETLGKSTGEALAKVFHRLRHPRESDSYELRLIDRARRITVVIDEAAGKDPHAFRSLAELPFDTLKERTTLRWHPDAAAWRRA